MLANENLGEVLEGEEGRSSVGQVTALAARVVVKLVGEGRLVVTHGRTDGTEVDGATRHSLVSSG